MLIGRKMFDLNKLRVRGHGSQRVGHKWATELIDWWGHGNQKEDRCWRTGFTFNSDVFMSLQCLKREAAWWSRSVDSHRHTHPFLYSVCCPGWLRQLLWGPCAPRQRAVSLGSVEKTPGCTLTMLRSARSDGRTEYAIPQAWLQTRASSDSCAGPAAPRRRAAMGSHGKEGTAQHLLARTEYRNRTAKPEPLKAVNASRKLLSPWKSIESWALGGIKSWKTCNSPCVP